MWYEYTENLLNEGKHQSQPHQHQGTLGSTSFSLYEVRQILYLAALLGPLSQTDTHMNKKN